VQFEAFVNLLSVCFSTFAFELLFSFLFIMPSRFSSPRLALISASHVQVESLKIVFVMAEEGKTISNPSAHPVKILGSIPIRHVDENGALIIIVIIITRVAGFALVRSSSLTKCRRRRRKKIEIYMPRVIGDHCRRS
jgi:hypothetical protein